MSTSTDSSISCSAALVKAEKQLLSKQNDARWADWKGEKPSLGPATTDETSPEYAVEAKSARRAVVDRHCALRGRHQIRRILSRGTAGPRSQGSITLRLHFERFGWRLDIGCAPVVVQQEAIR
jgi:hypothetical protein